MTTYYAIRHRWHSSDVWAVILESKTKNRAFKRRLARALEIHGKDNVEVIEMHVKKGGVWDA